MYSFIKMGVACTNILLPKPPNSLSKWAVIACDQFTSEPEYWAEVEEAVGSAPSAFNMVYPECYLSQGDARIGLINRYMDEYRQGVLSRAASTFVLVERETTGGNRLGLVLCVDLEKYDYTKGSKSLIRATEQTVEERIPPRVKIRRNATIEVPHVMLLVDDPGKTLIEPVYSDRDRLRPLYDFNLMMGGGHIRGWALDDLAMDGVQAALSLLYDDCEGLLFAVGDGNHSLATAKKCWEDKKAELSEAERENDPARFALVEVCNLHDETLVFEPIHRAVFNVDSAQLSHDFVIWCRMNGMSLTASTDEHAHLYLLDSPVSIENSVNPQPVAVLQPFLDEYLKAHGDAAIDYIHGEEALMALAEKGACCIRLKAFDKNLLFDSVRNGGPLPRKTFSMGEARDKRYYLECRAL